MRLLAVFVALMALGVTPAWGDGGRLEWPLRPRPAVVRAFDAPSPNWQPGHRGVDLVARAGQPVYAAGAGTVVFAGDLAGRPLVSIAHPGGLRTTYEPLRPAVRRGQAFFVRHLSLASLSLLHVGLVGGFGAPLIHPTLQATGYLTSEEHPRRTHRRVFETLSFVNDCLGERSGESCRHISS